MTSRRDAGRTSSDRSFFSRSPLRWLALTVTSFGLTAALVAGSGQTSVADPPLTVGEAKARITQLDAAAQLFVTPDTEGFLSQVSTVEKVSENQNAVLQSYQQEQAVLAETELAAETGLASLTEQERQLKTLRTASEKKIAESKAVLAKLSREQQRKIAAEERRAAAAVRDEAESGTEVEPAADESGDEDENEPVATGGSRGARAVAYARRQLGDPYRFATAGPDSFDCLGLTSAAWKSVGVSLPRSSRQQTGAGSPVSKSNLQPGDLVFYYSPVSHIALYAGNGQIIHAPRSGKSVEYASLDSMPYTGARRPG